MKIRVFTKGDQSVGIRGGECIIELPNVPLPENPAEREDIREHAQDFLSEIEGGVSAYAYFEDECTECGKELQDSKCSDQHCISNTQAHHWLLEKE